MSQRESKFQSELIKELKLIFHGCVVLKNDANYIQGFPDLLVLHRERWAALECKAYASALLQPNQEYYVDYLDGLGFARIIYPENKRSVLTELEQYFN